MVVGGDKRAGVLLIAAFAVLSVPRGAAQIANHAHGGSSSCTAQLGPGATTLVAEDDHAVQTVVNTISVGGVAGYTTYQISLLMAPEVQNVYTIYGDARPLEFPPAYQVATPFGVNIGGSNPAFFAMSPTANFDSWLTVGLTAGDTDNAVSSIGISFDAWSEQNALVSASDTGGSVFWMNPDAATQAVTYLGGTRSMVVAQLTLLSAAPSAACRFDAQGRSMGHTSGASTVADWEENCIEVMVGGAQNGFGSHSSTHVTVPPPPPPSYNPPPPPNLFGPTTTGCPASIDGFLSNGRWTITGTDASNQRATGTCNPGYVCTGCMPRDCRYEAATRTYRWSPANGRCTATGAPVPVATSCAGALPIVSGGSFAAPQGTAYPYPLYTRAELSCQNGYECSLGVGRCAATCQGTGDIGYSWNTQSAGTCVVACPTAAPAVVGGEWTRNAGSGATVTAHLTCNAGYAVSSAATITCSNNYWSGSGATCVKRAAGAAGGGPTTEAPDDGGGGWYYVVLLLLAAGGGYYAKENGLGPFATDGAKDLMGGGGPAPGGGESTIYDTGGDDTL